MIHAEAAIPVAVRDADGVFRQQGCLLAWAQRVELRICARCGTEWRGIRSNDWRCPECGWTLRWPARKR